MFKLRLKVAVVPPGVKMLTMNHIVPDANPVWDLFAMVISYCLFTVSPMSVMKTAPKHT